MIPVSPFEALLRTQGFVVLDGGLATTLEALGCDLNDELWSARVLLEEPGRILHELRIGDNGACGIGHGQGVAARLRRVGGDPKQAARPSRTQDGLRTGNR